MHITIRRLFNLFHFCYSIEGFDAFRRILRNPITLQEAHDLILHFFPCNNPRITNPLTIINIDETNTIFRADKGSYLREVLRNISNTITEQKRFIFTVLSGTHASSLFKTVESSGAKISDIPLPLLEPEHAKEVILELANRGLVSFCYCHQVSITAIFIYTNQFISFFFRVRLKRGEYLL